MAAATNGRAGTGRASWVAFADERLVKSSEQQSDHVTSGSQRPPSTDASSSIEPVAPPPQHNAWILFDEKPWPAPPPQPQVKGPRTSVCSTASFWSVAPPSETSWTSQSERSSVSMGASSCDLPSLNTEEPANHTSSRPPSPNSSVFPEDEGIDMDSISWSSNAKNTNGQSETTSTTRFSTWVTFDDDEERSHRQRPQKPSCINLDIVSFQDTNSNTIASPFWKQDQVRNQNDGCVRHLLDLTPDGPRTTGLDTLLQNNTPYAKKNPFLDEEFNNIQPSPINPFTSYFHTKQEVDRKEEVRSTAESNGTHTAGPPCAFSFSSPFFPSHASDAKQESIHLFSSEFEPSGDGGNEGKVSHDTPPIDHLDLNQLRNLQIPDPDDPGSPTLPDDLLTDEEEEEEEDETDGVERTEETRYQPDHMTPQEGWPMLLRIPEKKNIMSSRHWGPIYVRLSGEGVLQLFYERGLDKPFRTLRLEPRHEASEHRLQSYEETGRVHTISVDLVQYRERRRIQPKAPVTHQPIREQLVKLGTTSYSDYLSFRHALVELLRRLPFSVTARSPSPTTPVGSVPSDEEMHVEVRDEFYGVVGEGDGRVLKRAVITRVHVLAFLSGSPACRLGLNDVQVKGKEVVSRHDIIPNTTSRWIRLRDCELHDEHADRLDFLSMRAVTFTPPPRQRFELLRFATTFAEKTLPFTLRTVASVRGAEVTLQSWLLMSQGFSSNRDTLNLIPCENVSVRYPIPETWAKNFRRDGVMGERSLKARFNKGASFGTASTSGAEPVMRVTLGTAKYEQAFRSVVWRLNRLPDKNSALGHPHTFFCRLELGSDREVPDSLQRHLEVEFDMPAASASKATVRSLSVADRTDVKKWITYKAHYFYQVPIEQKMDSISESGPVQDQPGDCSPQ